jgi:hypothetical protein
MGIPIVMLDEILIEILGGLLIEKHDFFLNKLGRNQVFPLEFPHKFLKKCQLTL